MKKKVFPVFLLVFFILSFFSSLPFQADTSAGFSCGFDQTRANREELIRLHVRFAGTSPVPAGFRIRVSFDGDAVQYVRTEAASALGDGTVKTNAGEEEICSVYVCNPQEGYAPPLSGTVISYLFRVCTDAPAGSTNFAVTMDQICDYEENSMLGCSQNLDLRIAPEKSSQAYLTELVPSEGKLRPEFSPDVFEYRLSVGWQTQTVTFEADAGESGTVKVNRKTLGGKDTDTPITLTVTSADKTSKLAYLVTVHRGEMPVSSQPETASAAEQADTSHSRKESAVPRRTTHRISKKTIRADVPAVQEEERTSNGEDSGGEVPAQSFPEQARYENLPPGRVPVLDDDDSEAEECGVEDPAFAEAGSCAPIRFVGNTMPSFFYKLTLFCCLGVCAVLLRRRYIAGTKKP